MENQKNKKEVSDLSQLSDDQILDEAVERLKSQYRKKTGKEPYGVSFEFLLRYERLYEVMLYKRQDFYRSQPKLALVPELDP